jgi:hypothetical protein
LLTDQSDSPHLPDSDDNSDQNEPPSPEASNVLIRLSSSSNAEALQWIKGLEQACSVLADSVDNEDDDDNDETQYLLESTHLKVRNRIISFNNC